MLGLLERKEIGLPPIKISVSPRVCPEIFVKIMELNPSSSTKKKGKGRKGKKVNTVTPSFAGCLTLLDLASDQD